MFNFPTYKNEIITDADMTKLEQLAELVHGLKIDEIIANMKQVADIEMNKRQAWNYFGDNSGNNIMLKQIEQIESGFNVLKRCVDDAEIAGIKANRETAV